MLSEEKPEKGKTLHGITCVESNKSELTETE